MFFLLMASWVAFLTTQPIFIKRPACVGRPSQSWFDPYHRIMGEYDLDYILEFSKMYHNPRIVKGAAGQDWAFLLGFLTERHIPKPTAVLYVDLWDWLSVEHDAKNSWYGHYQTMVARLGQEVADQVFFFVTQTHDNPHPHYLNESPNCTTIERVALYNPSKPLN